MILQIRGQKTGPDICKFVDKRQPNDKRQSDNHQIYSTDAISSTRSGQSLAIMTNTITSQPSPETTAGGPARTMSKAPPRPLVQRKNASQKTSEELAPEFATLTLTPEELQLITTLRTKWANRCPVWKDVSTAQWQHTQERMLPLLVLPVWELIEEFDARRDAFLWSETTCLQYWTAIRSAATTADLVLPVEFKKLSKVLGFLAKTSTIQK
jgi:hypothetical protein